MKRSDYKRLPLLSAFALRLLAHRKTEYGLFGDIEELYNTVLTEKGNFKARLWLWRQIITTIPSVIKDTFYWGQGLVANYLKTAFRNVIRYKAFSLINLSGLAVGMASFILLFLYIQYELSFDKFNERSDRIYRIVIKHDGNFRGTNLAVGSPAPLAPKLSKDFPEIESSTRMKKAAEVLISSRGNSFLENSGYFADGKLFEIFSFVHFMGDPETSLKDPYSIVISEKMAKKYFGSDEPLGKTLVCKERHADRPYLFTVTGVIRDIPDNSHLKIDILFTMEAFAILRDRSLEQWNDNSFYTYLLLKENAQVHELEKKITGLISGIIDNKNSYYLQPLSDIHLYSEFNSDVDSNNDIKYLYLLAVVAVTVLIIACVNFMNLSTARSVYRSKEVGIRKVVGARRKQLIEQFLGESVFLSVLALGLALLIVKIAMPFFNTFVERDLNLNIFENLPLFIGLIVLTLFAGLFSGSYPAIILSSLKPISVLKGSGVDSLKKAGLRNSLVIFQFSISIILIICALIVKSQLDFIKNKDAGYAREHIINIPLMDETILTNFNSVKSELSKNSNILSVAFSSSLPNQNDWAMWAYWPDKPDDETFVVYSGMIDIDFVDLYDMDIIQGRNFSRDFPSDIQNAVILNETAVKAIGWDSPLGKEFSIFRGDFTVIGVIKDFHMASFRYPIEPYCYVLGNENSEYFFTISIKISGENIPDTIEYMRNTFKSFSPDYPFEYNFFDDLYNRVYLNEYKTGKILFTFSSLAIFLASLGLIGLISFAIAKKTKEIGIRKVLGASGRNIVFLLSGDLIKCLAAANAVAWPAAFFIMKWWLDGFVFRVETIYPAFFLSAGFTLLIALLTICIHVLKAASSDPVKSLKCE